MSQSIKEKLKNLENQNQLLTSNLVDSIWVLNAATLRYEYVAPPFNRRDGYTAKELIGRSILEELAPRDAEIAVEMLEQALDDYDQGKHETKSFEMEAIRKNGDKHWVEIKAKLIEEPGRPLKIVGVTRDITARKTVALQMEKEPGTG
ncbi:hypothetical protein DSCW_43430 [Desulfosarcina widdelii]|uniref:PAC domain-containing protein n=1 Tax=Desulfosarcina widdelii TaxID=947919 RepID=A0A5K7Z580_9BACT|nr:PAS domain S-box protein [Desulfosarcina widdelii]BBO76926.1 hypothetical protein DSCW_43430 [Desulfosarcina widdelii]